MVTYNRLLEVLKDGFIDGSDAVVDECVTKQHSQNTYPHVVLTVALSTQQYVCTARRTTNFFMFSIECRTCLGIGQAKGGPTFTDAVRCTALR